MKKSTLALVFCFALASAGAYADEGKEGHHHHDGPCKADREKFCKDLKPGKGLWKCMHEHHSELSEGCQKMMEKRHKKHEEKEAAQKS